MRTPRRKETRATTGVTPDDEPLQL